MPPLRRRAASITPSSRRRSLATAALTGLALTLAAAPAPAATSSPTASAKAKAKAAERRKLRRDLWATVNICDTTKFPGTIGIRGSMPGSGVKGERMYMRFALQYYDQQEKRWANTGSTSEFVAVGSARSKRRESGYNYTVRPPRVGAFYLRGRVTFEWRRKAKVTRRLFRRTTAKHPSTAGADPKNYSASKCVLRA